MTVGRTLIHLDTDIAGDPDDVCALALLLSLPDAELTGITTVTERGGRRAGYAHEVLRLAGRPDVPVAAGAETGIDPLPLIPGIPDGPEFWLTAVNPRPNGPDDALELIDRSVKRGATVVGIGPYTNLALYEQKHPGALAKTGLVVMGGCISPVKPGLPPWGPNEDWNMFIDPAATRMIFERCNPLVVPIDVTIQVHLRRRDVPRLRRSGQLGSLIASQGEAHDAVHGNHKLSAQYPLLPDDLLNFHHDPLAAAVAVGWDGVRIEQIPLRLKVTDRFPVLERDAAGQLFRVVTQVNAEAFDRYWLDVVTHVLGGDAC